MNTTREGIGFEIAKLTSDKTLRKRIMQLCHEACRLQRESDYQHLAGGQYDSAATELFDSAPFIVPKSEE